MKILILVFSLCFLSLSSVQAASAGDMIINEIAWMGTKESATKEWIELYNNTDQPIDVNGWILKATDGTPTVKLAGSFPANGFYLLERSKDYTGALNNKGEKLELYDNLGNLIDSVDASSGWPAGDNSTKQTMERKDGQSWQTSQDTDGTPKAENSAPVKETAPQLASFPPSATQSKIINTEKKSEKDNLTENLAAAAGGQIPQVKDVSAIILLTALALAVFSGVIILILKKGLK